MKKKDIITIIVLLVIFGIIFLIASINKDDEVEINKKTEYHEITLVTDEDIFLSVSNNISKSFEHSDYIIKNNIYKNMSFKAEKMYVVSKGSLYKYYVEGALYQITENAPKYIRKEYFILNYDINSKAYNVETINKEIYTDAKNEEYKFENIDVNNYNNFEYITLTDKNRASMYFNDFIEKMYLYPEEAYNLLSNVTKERYFNTFKDFEKFIKKYKSITLKEYGATDKQIGILDNNGIQYTFDISYILKYNVTIDMTEE